MPQTERSPSAWDRFGPMHMWVHLVSSENISHLSGRNHTIDGVDLQDMHDIAIVGMGTPPRVLLRAQTDPSENGLWETNAGAWRRVDHISECTAYTTYNLPVEYSGDCWADTSWLRETGDYTITITASGAVP
jgi:hypothetical protein